MHATTDVQFEFSIDDDKTVPLAALGEELTEQNIEATIFECEKYARGNGDECF